MTEHTQTGARLSVERLTWGPMGCCVACRKHPAIGPMGYCGTCHWELVIEVVEAWPEFDNLLSEAHGS